MSLVYVCRDELGNYSIEDNPPPEEDTSLPPWAVRAGRIMFAIGQPKLRDAGWEAFAVVERGCRNGSRLALQIREGLRRIAKALLKRRQRMAADPLAELDSIKMTTPDLLPEAGGSIRA